MQEIRCEKCNKKLGMINGDYEIKCPRCNAINSSSIITEKPSVIICKSENYEECKEILK